MESRIVNDPLCASRCRDADCRERECDELFHGVLSLRCFGFSGDTPPITGDDLPRGKGGKMYVVQKMLRSPWHWKGNGYEGVRQSPNVGLPTSMFAMFVSILIVSTDGHASIFQDLKNCCQASHDAANQTPGHSSIRRYLVVGWNVTPSMRCSGNCTG